jgi:hypothetical protein
MAKIECAYSEWDGRIPTCEYGFYICDYNNCKYYTPNRELLLKGDKHDCD